MLNSLVGYKPPLGSWSTSGVVPACASLDCVTVFANSLEDAELVNGIARGYDTNCCWSRHYEIKGKELPDKIYISKDEPKFFGRFENVYREKWHKAVKRIESLGIKVERVDFEMFSKAASILYDGAYVAERWQDLKDFVNNNPEKVFPVTKKILLSGAREECTAARLFQDLHELSLYKHKAEELLQNAVMIMPTAGGSFTRDEVRENPVETNSLMGLYTNHCNLLDLAAIAVPENSQDTENPFGITIFSLHNAEHLISAVAKEFIESEKMKIAVCGLHKKGRELEYQLTQLGADYVTRTRTSKEYKLYKLNTTPPKPGMIRTQNGDGGNIEVDIYEIAKTNFGKFIEDVKTPLCIGDVILENGEIVKGFLCEPSYIEFAEDITKDGKY
jgi:allophanate hydrolase